MWPGFSFVYCMHQLDSPMALYGSVPLLFAHNEDVSTGVFWLNAAETWVDIVHSDKVSTQFSSAKLVLCAILKLKCLSIIMNNKQGKLTHWFSESGIIDVFFLMGPTPTDLFKQYAILTGKYETLQSISFHSSKLMKILHLGTTPLPQLFSIAYHQCKWNYKDEEDVRQVDEGSLVHKVLCIINILIIF